MLSPCRHSLQMTGTAPGADTRLPLPRSPSEVTSVTVAVTKHQPSNSVLSIPLSSTVITLPPCNSFSREWLYVFGPVPNGTLFPP